MSSFLIAGHCTASQPSPQRKSLSLHFWFPFPELPPQHYRDLLLTDLTSYWTLSSRKKYCLIWNKNSSILFFLKKISFITLRSYQTPVKQKMWIMDDDLSSYFLFPSSICHDIGLAITKLRIITERNDPPGHNSELTTPLIDQYKGNKPSF